MTFFGKPQKNFTNRAVGINMFIQVELSRIVICEFNQHQVIFLKEKHGTREMPVVIGLFEATMIDRKLKKIPTPRPLTHDLFCQAVKALGGQMEAVEIYRAEGQTYYAHLRMKQGEKEILLDARPSDAIALALCFSPPLLLYVSEEVLNAGAIQ